VSDEQLRELHRRSRALLMPGIEDFGIVPVEAMACGTPVLALDTGGTVDTVVPGLSGAHVAAGADEAVVAGFVDALRTHRVDDYDPAAIRAHAETFSRAAFRSRMRAVVDGFG